MSSYSPILEHPWKRRCKFDRGVAFEEVAIVAIVV
jgi:hypothetical protein